MVSHNYGTIRSYCDMGAVLENGELTFYDTLDEAYAVYRKMGASA
jgi:capsular polysaccharide transport system ATP-binding protein